MKSEKQKKSRLGRVHFPALGAVQVRVASSSDWCTEFSTTVLIGQTIRRF